MNALETYQQNLAALAGAREKAGGRITPFEENARLTELDNLWMRLDGNQRQQIVQIWGMEKPHKPHLPAQPPMPQVSTIAAAPAMAPAMATVTTMQASPPAPAPTPAAPAPPRYTEQQLSAFREAHRPRLNIDCLTCSELQISYAPHPQNPNLQDMSMVCDESDLPIVYTAGIRISTIRLWRPFLPHEPTGPFTELLLEGGQTINIVGSVEDIAPLMVTPKERTWEKVFFSQHALVQELVTLIIRTQPEKKESALDAVRETMTEVDRITNEGSDSESAEVGVAGKEPHTAKHSSSRTTKNASS